MRNWLKELRKSADMTQATAAEKAGMSRVYYVRIENGERQKRLDLDIAQKLSQVFGVTVDWIIEQENKTA